MAEKVWQTTCPMDCPDTCALEVAVENGRVTAIRAREDGHPNTAGFICSKVAQFDKRLYHQDRVLYPMRRKGKKGEADFERISWDDAIAEITGRFGEIREKFGGEAIRPFHYDGSNGYLSAEFMDDLFFARLGTSRLQKTICAAPTGAVTKGMYGKLPGVPFEDYPRAKCIIIWGANPKASNIHLVPYLKEAKRNGAFIAVVDPRNNFSSGEIDLHLPVLPGADLPLALALIHEWKSRGQFAEEHLRDNTVGADVLLAAAEEWPVEKAAAACGVPAKDIRLLAEKYAELSPAVVRCGWGPERNRNGGQAIAAILALPALMGKFGVRGGGYSLSNSGAFQMDAEALLGPLNWTTREINMTRLAAVLDGEVSPPVKALFVYNCNPAVTVPEQNGILRALASDDLFTVVHEQVMTDTARYADVLLPATTFLEHHEIRRGYGAYVVGGGLPVIEPEGEAKPNEWVFAALGRAMGFKDEAFQWDSRTCFRKIAEQVVANGQPVDADLIAAGGLQAIDFGKEGFVQGGKFPLRTPNGKINLSPECLGTAPYIFDPVRSEKYPLALISPGNNKMISSTFGEFNYPELKLALHPSDAAARKIRSGDTVRVFNELGEVVCIAEVKDRIRSGVASMPKGAWRKSSRNGQTATALAPATTNIVGGGACYNDARVEVERMAGE